MDAEACCTLRPDLPDRFVTYGDVLVVYSQSLLAARAYKHAMSLPTVSADPIIQKKFAKALALARGENQDEATYRRWLTRTTGTNRQNHTMNSSSSFFSFAIRSRPVTALPGRQEPLHPFDEACPYPPVRSASPHRPYNPAERGGGGGGAPNDDEQRELLYTYTPRPSSRPESAYEASRTTPISSIPNDSWVKPLDGLSHSLREKYHRAPREDRLMMKATVGRGQVVTRDFPSPPPPPPPLSVQPPPPLPMDASRALAAASQDNAGKLLVLALRNEHVDDQFEPEEEPPQLYVLQTPKQKEVIPPGGRPGGYLTPPGTAQGDRRGERHD